MIVTGYFFVYVHLVSIQGQSYYFYECHTKHHHDPLSSLCSYCGIAVIYPVIQLLLLYISLYLYYIWYRFSFLCKSILPFKEMAKLVLTVVYTVIYSYSCYIYCYISLIYTLSYYRNFVYSPQSTQLHLVTQLHLNE